METEEILENKDEITKKIGIVKGIKKNRNFYTNEEIVLIITVAGIGIIFLVLMWVFGVNLAPG